MYHNLMLGIQYDVIANKELVPFLGTFEFVLFFRMLLPGSTFQNLSRKPETLYTNCTGELSQLEAQIDT